MNALVEPPQVFLFIPQRIARLAAAFFYALGKLNHLIDRLFAVEPHDIVEHKLAHLIVGFARATGQYFREHRHHDFGPAFAD